jgi:hypothetical protein
MVLHLKGLLRSFLLETFKNVELVLREKWWAIMRDSQAYSIAQ